MQENKPFGTSHLASVPAPTSGATALAPRVDSGTEALSFAGNFKVETYPHNSVVYRPGEVSKRVYLLKQGRVRLMRVGKNGIRSVVSILKPGDLFGERLFERNPTGDELAVVANEAEIWSVDESEFKSQLEARPALAMEIIHAYSGRLELMRRRVLGLTFKDVPARLADTILSLAESHGEACPHGGEIDLKGITQQDLADLVGASRSFVSTLVNDLKRDGMLSNVGRILCVRDQRALRALAANEK